MTGPSRIGGVAVVGAGARRIHEPTITQCLAADNDAAWPSGALSGLRTHIPEVREGRPEQRIPQILRPRRSACPDPHAYDPLDRFHMPVAPFLDALVDIEQGL